MSYCDRPSSLSLCQHTLSRVTALVRFLAADMQRLKFKTALKGHGSLPHTFSERALQLALGKLQNKRGVSKYLRNSSASSEAFLYWWAVVTSPHSFGIAS